MIKINGLKISVCQMKVVPGRPDLNTLYMCNEIRSAQARKVDIIVFPEMSVTGYQIGDLYEDLDFIRDVQRCNEQIRLATQSGIVAIFGSIMLASIDKTSESGRRRIHNAAMVAQNGRWIGQTYKFLQPNYRIFDDDRHFYSLRKLREENIEGDVDTNGIYKQDELALSRYLLPFKVKIRSRQFKIGAIICEDMWKDDYFYNPTKILTDNGAEIIFNISASPWTWQKNRKRHRVVRALLDECRVPFVYVNNTGVQNSGKNIIVFDGSSTVYNRWGDRVFEVPAYQDGTHDIVLKENLLVLSDEIGNDTTELYQSLRCAISEFINNLPLAMRKVVIGVSGGIDSALSLALFVDILGPQNVIAVNMPSRFNSRLTRNIAKQMAENLGVNYEVKPIVNIVKAIAKATGTDEGTPSYANIMARTRMEVLAAMAQDNNCVYIANWNKIEAAFGYGTLYGDMAGFMAPLGDLTKREVYQLSHYLNKTVFKRSVIPQECFDLAPTAELKENQTDPFDYGHLNRRGYHDEMVRAFVEFRRNPEWFLELYLTGQLEKELMLEEGQLKKLFPTDSDFIKDLERCWGLFFGSYFKRVQSAPIPIVSKRAFGFDLRESILSPHFTDRYQKLKDTILFRATNEKQVVIYGGSFNPPGRHHRLIVEDLAKRFDEVVVYPCGLRKDKVSVNAVSVKHRKALVEKAFAGIPKVKMDFYDLDHDVYTPTFNLEKRFQAQYGNARVWHAIGEDLIAGGANQNSEIQRAWCKGEEVWKKLNFIVMTRPGYGAKKEDRPPQCQVIDYDDIFGSGTLIREKIENGQRINSLVIPAVEAYIRKHDLYK